MNSVSIRVAHHLNRLHVSDKSPALKGNACSLGANPDDIYSVLIVYLNMTRCHRCNNIMLVALRGNTSKYCFIVTTRIRERVLDIFFELVSIIGEGFSSWGRSQRTVDRRAIMAVILIHIKFV